MFRVGASDVLLHRAITFLLFVALVSMSETIEFDNGIVRSKPKTAPSI